MTSIPSDSSDIPSNNHAAGDDGYTFTRGELAGACYALRRAREVRPDLDSAEEHAYFALAAAIKDKETATNNLDYSTLVWAQRTLDRARVAHVEALRALLLTKRRR